MSATGSLNYSLNISPPFSSSRLWPHRLNPHNYSIKKSQKWLSIWIWIIHQLSPSIDPLTFKFQCQLKMAGNWTVRCVRLVNNVFAHNLEPIKGHVLQGHTAKPIFVSSKHVATTTCLHTQNVSIIQYKIIIKQYSLQKLSLDLVFNSFL